MNFCFQQLVPPYIYIYFKKNTTPPTTLAFFINQKKKSPKCKSISYNQLYSIFNILVKHPVCGCGWERERGREERERSSYIHFCGGGRKYRERERKRWLYFLPCFFFKLSSGLGDGVKTLHPY
jgi:hypothetical protein